MNAHTLRPVHQKVSDELPLTFFRSSLTFLVHLCSLTSDTSSVFLLRRIGSELTKQCLVDISQRLDSRNTTFSSYCVAILRQVDYVCYNIDWRKVTCDFTKQ